VKNGVSGNFFRKIGFRPEKVFVAVRLEIVDGSEKIFGKVCRVFCGKMRKIG